MYSVIFGHAFGFYHLVGKRDYFFGSIGLFVTNITQKVMYGLPLKFVDGKRNKLLNFCGEQDFLR